MLKLSPKKNSEICLTKKLKKSDGIFEKIISFVEMESSKLINYGNYTTKAIHHHAAAFFLYCKSKLQTIRG
jgi:hypothetical protein